MCITMLTRIQLISVATKNIFSTGNTQSTTAVKPNLGVVAKSTGSWLGFLVKVVVFFLAVAGIVVAYRKYQQKKRENDYIL